MDIHIDLCRRQVKKQGDNGMPVARKHFCISAAHSADEQPVLDRTAINEQKLMIGDAAIIGRQAGDAAKPHALALEIKCNAVFDKLAAGQCRNAFGAR